MNKGAKSMTNIGRLFVFSVSFFISLLLYGDSFRASAFDKRFRSDFLAQELPKHRDKEECNSGVRVLYFGLFVIVVGIITTTILIGIPILILGKVIAVIGLLMWLWQMATC
jgi:hypothetical protein